MRTLIVGGTGFLGGAIADAATRAGHEVAILSRSQAARSPPQGMEIIQADRYGDLRRLSGREFEWVFDTCAYAPDAVLRLLDAVDSNLRRYVLASSVSIYGDFTRPGISEDDPVPQPTEEDFAVARAVAPQDRALATAYGASYGPLKRGCEIAATERLGDRATNLRLGLLAGAGDYTDRLTWWARRIDEARGERRSVPAPGPPDRPVQLIDVRDAAAFALHCANEGHGGVWNVTGQSMEIGTLLSALAETARSPAKFIWFNDSDAAKADVVPWIDMPLMVPPLPHFRYFLDVDTRRARAAGLSCRPLIETLRPLLDWDRQRRPQPLKVGLTLEQELKLLGR